MKNKVMTIKYRVKPGPALSPMEEPAEGFKKLIANSINGRTQIRRDIRLPEFAFIGEAEKFSGLIISGLEAYPENKVYVFDEKGKMIFRSSGYQNDWNGLINTGWEEGKEAEEGYYYLVVTKDPCEMPLDGFFYLFRENAED